MNSTSELISYHKGHTIGKNGKKIYNPYEIWEDDKGKYVKMFDSSNRYFFFDYNDLEHVLKKNENNISKNITWNLIRNHKVKDRKVYYVSAHFGKTTRRIHQHILNYYGKGCKGITIDHIDRDPLNNRRYNLRLVNKSEQNRNTNKRVRKKNTYELPNEIKDIKLPKYVYYTKLVRNNTKLGYDECFTIQCHPGLKNKNKQWVTTRSMKVTIQVKLDQAINKLKELDIQHKNNTQHTL